MDKLERLKVERADLKRKIRDAEARRDTLRDQVNKSINALEAQEREIESAFGTLYRIGDKLSRQS